MRTRKAAVKRAKASSWSWDETGNRPAVNGRKASSIWPAIRFHHENILQEKKKTFPLLILFCSLRESCEISYCEFLFARAPKSWNLKNNLLPSNKYPKNERKKATDDDENLLVIIKTYYPADKIYVASFALFHMLKRFMVSEWSCVTLDLMYEILKRHKTKFHKSSLKFCGDRIIRRENVALTIIFIFSSHFTSGDRTKMFSVIIMDVSPGKDFSLRASFLVFWQFCFQNNLKCLSMMHFQAF